MIRRLFLFLALVGLLGAEETLRQVKVTLDYMGESGTTLSMPIDANGNTDPEALVGLTIEGNRQMIRFGNLFRNHIADTFDQELFKQLLRCANVRIGTGQPNTNLFKTNVNGVTGEGGLWMPKRVYYIGKIERIGDESPANPLWRITFADNLTEANSVTGGSLSFEFTSLDIDVNNRPPATVVEHMLPGLILRRISGSHVNPPAPAQLNAFRDQVNALVIEY